MSLSFLGPLIGAALGGRSKPHRHTSSFLGLGGGSSSFLNARSLLGMAGLATAAYQIFRTHDQSGSSASPPIVVPNQTTVIREPRGSTAPPPLPNPSTNPGVQRILRLVISAARCDGALGDVERAAILARAREIGLESLVDEELRQPRPLYEIVAGVVDPSEKEALYVLAYSIVRADQGVNGAERVFLVQLANLLGLGATEVQRIERETAARIDGAS